jgi:hypothetical protein
MVILFYRQDLWASFLTEYATVEDRLRRKLVELKQTEDEFKVWIESLCALRLFFFELFEPHSDTRSGQESRGERNIQAGCSPPSFNFAAVQRAM